MKSIKSILAAAVVLIMAYSTPASAEVCKIEEFICQEPLVNRGVDGGFLLLLLLLLEGTSTCYSGDMLLRLYDNERYIGNAEGRVSNYSFNVNVWISKENRKSLNIKYSIASPRDVVRRTPASVFKIHPPCWK